MIARSTTWSGFPAARSAWLQRSLSREAPVHRVTVDGFWIDRTPVTNQQFRAFVKATGHKTFAEIHPIQRLSRRAPHRLYAGSLVFSPPPSVTNLRDWSQWWQFMKGADWRHPMVQSNINVQDNHPVVHVCFSDALAYAQWAGKDLPTEPNGNSRRAAGSMVPNSHGAMNSRPAVRTWPTPGRANFHSRISIRMATSAPRR